MFTHLGITISFCLPAICWRGGGSNQAAIGYQPTALTANTTYYWQVVAKGTGGSANGPVWSFTTVAAARPAPVAAYGFNEGSGTTTSDATGSGRTGTLNNATWSTAGKNGGALSFNGTSSRVVHDGLDRGRTGGESFDAPGIVNEHPQRGGEI